jgi:hypothetical protein
VALLILAADGKRGNFLWPRRRSGQATLSATGSSTTRSTVACEGSLHGRSGGSVPPPRNPKYATVPTDKTPLAPACRLQTDTEPPQFLRLCLRRSWTRLLQEKIDTLATSSSSDPAERALAPLSPAERSPRRVPVARCRSLMGGGGGGEPHRRRRSRGAGRESVCVLRPPPSASLARYSPGGQRGAVLHPCLAGLTKRRVRWREGSPRCALRAVSRCFGAALPCFPRGQQRLAASGERASPPEGARGTGKPRPRNGRRL